MRFVRRLSLTAVSALLLIACGDDQSSTTDTKTSTLTLLAYESFTPPPDAFDAFTAETGIKVEIVAAGDTGEMVAKAALTSGNPEGDVMWGVDNTLLSRAVDAEIFDPYVSNVEGLDSDLIASGLDTVTPVDYGDVCLNYDIAALESLGLRPPASFADLASPEYRDLLVMPSAISSSTGLAFLLGSIAQDPDGWSQTWAAIANNGLLVVDGWYEAYYTEFSRYGGTRPLVVSYASSPPAEVIFAEPPLPEGAPAPTAVVVDTCFRQIEYAGVLRGTEHTDEARMLIDYLASRTFQGLLPESIFVFPANTRAKLPKSFVDHVAPVTNPLLMDATTIANNRDRWLEEWDALVG